MVNSSKAKTFDEIIDKMDELGILFCGFPEMKEQYCSHYKYEIEGIGTGGFCTCTRDCNSCHSKEWCDELSIPIDKQYLIRQKEEAMRKPVQKVKQRTNLDNWLKFIKNNK